MLKRLFSYRSHENGLFRLFRLLAYLNYTRRTPFQARSPVIFHSRTRFVARVPSTAKQPIDCRHRRLAMLRDARHETARSPGADVQLIPHAYVCRTSEV